MINGEFKSLSSNRTMPILLAQYLITLRCKLNFKATRAAHVHIHQLSTWREPVH